MKKSISIILTVFTAVLLFLPLTAEELPVLSASAEDEIQTIVTEYSDLWTGTISVKVGVPVKWYVNVPEGTEPRGCGATIKIPDLGWGTDTHNNEEGHLVLTEGENFIYEFTPEETGDILFTCWMGSGCHSNYIHITEDGTYDLQKPGDPQNITAARDGDKVEVSFDLPENPDNVTIREYRVTALADDGTKVRRSGMGSPIILENTDNNKAYTITIVTVSVAGKSEGANSYLLEAETDSDPEEPEEDPQEEEQIVITEYDGLWTDNITVKVGVPVKWYVNVPEGTALMGCARTIKIPGLGWGTDTNSRDEGHLTLEEGENFVYEFTPTETGDILFTCWMGSGCHYNYIHVTEDGEPVPSANTEVTNTDSISSDAPNTVTSAVENKSTTNSADANKSSKSASDNTASSPKTGTASPIALEVLLVSFGGIAIITRKHNKK